MAATGGTAMYEKGVDSARVSALAASSDAAVVVVGLTHRDEGEWFVLNPTWEKRAVRPPYFGGGGDRVDLSLSVKDVALVRQVAAVQPNTVVVVVGGSAITMPWREHVPAIVMNFYAGMQGGHALADIVFGRVNPSGKLPLTIPEDSEDCPPFEPFAKTANYGPLHGYRMVDTLQTPVAYAFGFGLSYTTFAFPSVEVVADADDWRVVVDVHNTGSRDGAEVIQVYIAFPGCTVHRPGHRLVAFEKVNVKAGQTTTVTLSIPAALRQAYLPGIGWHETAADAVVQVGNASNALFFSRRIART